MGRGHKRPNVGLFIHKTITFSSTHLFYFKPIVLKMTLFIIILFFKIHFSNQLNTLNFAKIWVQIHSMGALGYKYIYNIFIINVTCECTYTFSLTWHSVLNNNPNPKTMFQIRFLDLVQLLEIVYIGCTLSLLVL